MKAGGPNWEEVDKSKARTKAREGEKKVVYTTTKIDGPTVKPMSDEEYEALVEEQARIIRSANPHLSEADVELKAREEADRVRSNQQHSITSSVSTQATW